MGLHCSNKIVDQSGMFLAVQVMKYCDEAECIETT